MSDPDAVPDPVKDFIEMAKSLSQTAGVFPPPGPPSPPIKDPTATEQDEMNNARIHYINGFLVGMAMDKLDDMSFNGMLDGAELIEGSTPLSTQIKIQLANGRATALVTISTRLV